MSVMEGLVAIVFILSLLMISGLIIQRSYSHDGKIIIDKDPDSGRITFTLELDADPYEIEHMKIISFKVVNKQVIAE